MQGHNYDFSKDIDVRFKSCFHGGREIPGDGPLSVFNAYTTNAGTCAVACSAQQFRCENGAIVPVDGVSQILNYPFATCANPTPGSCSGSGAACGSVGSFYVKPANTSLCTSGSVSSFSPGAQPTGTPINSAGNMELQWCYFECELLRHLVSSTADLGERSLYNTNNTCTSAHYGRVFCGYHRLGCSYSEWV